MKNLKLPERYNYAEAYLTFRCNLDCDYCINKFGKLKDRDELTAKEWINSLNRIDFGQIPLTLGGGEPTLHKEFYKIINNLEHKVDLLTNLQFDIQEFIKKVDRNNFTESSIYHYHPIRISYHAERMNREKIINDALQLMNSGFNIGIFGIRHPYTINENMAMSFSCTKMRIPFYEKDFLGEVDGRIYGYYKYPKGLNPEFNDHGQLKEVKCRTRELLIAPNGDIHRCHRDLYKSENPIENIQGVRTLEDNFRPCSNYGECNPCDLKLKTNKYLRNIECQIEIKE